MYITSKKHILSNAIMMTAITKIIAALCEGVLRIVFRKQDSLTPDMLDTMMWYSQLTISALQIAAAGLIFFFAWKKVNHYIAIVPKNDRRQMGALQEEVFGKDIASLSVTSIIQLIELWAVIFVGAELIYIFTSIMYRKFISTLMNALPKDADSSGSAFVILYNMTHGFKYLEILSAILLGIVVTAIFLNDQFLKLASLGVLLLFLIPFGALQMHTVYFFGREIGIVWSSVVYHFTETAGLFLLSFYLSRVYKGM
ncbi:hypothetical protein [Butyrivibrio sp. VCD2006]|uniref:hypothetical protein n=1 Tax=Butyrivibrio sp. VCD2006 TaxID=1280664 RepID=UPI0003F6EE11|nr:hypothetical protein [Butyrivibrio sp. VCD2006]